MHLSFHSAVPNMLVCAPWPARGSKMAAVTFQAPHKDNNQRQKLYFSSLFKCKESFPETPIQDFSWCWNGQTWIFNWNEEWNSHDWLRLIKMHPELTSTQKVNPWMKSGLCQQGWRVSWHIWVAISYGEMTSLLFPSLLSSPRGMLIHILCCDLIWGKGWGGGVREDLQKTYYRLPLSTKETRQNRETEEEGSHATGSSLRTGIPAGHSWSEQSHRHPAKDFSDLVQVL